jgi:hypothetical protein
MVKLDYIHLNPVRDIVEKASIMAILVPLVCFPDLGLLKIRKAQTFL